MPILRRHLWLLLSTALLAACTAPQKHASPPPDAGGIIAGQTAPARNPDPWEGWNRRVHRFNNAVDRSVARPVARTYVRAVPAPVRTSIGNFFSNLGQPVSALNALLQGKPKQAGQSLARFVLNLTLGIGGLFDPASDANLPKGQEDFGQTLAVWGWKHSRYFELPLLGPRTLRDSFGLGGDIAASPLRQIDDTPVRYGLAGLNVVDVRAQLLSVDSLREGVPDDYTLVRDAWLQRRQHQIFGRRGAQEQTLPDYLFDEPDDEPDAAPGAQPAHTSTSR